MSERVTRCAHLASLCTTLLGLVLPCVASAQVANTDSVFTVGPCRIRTAEQPRWETVVSPVDTPPRVVPGGVPLFPLRLRTEPGFSARVVLAMVVDSAGRVEPWSISVEESTDPRLSAWGCLVALDLRFLPAIVGGRPVSALTEVPVSYNIRRSPGRSLGRP